MTSLARARSPGLAFAFYVTAEVGIAALVTASLPGALAALGGHAPFIAIAAVAAAALLATPALPRFTAPIQAWNWRQLTPLPAAASWAIVALFLFFAGQGALWTFLEPIGQSRSIDQPSIIRALTLINFAGLAGTFGIGALAHRVNPLAALLCLSGIALVSVLTLFNTHTSTAFIVSTCGFYFAWCASFPFQFSLIARADAGGTASAVVSAVDALGLAAGAALAGWGLPHAGVSGVGWLWAAGTILGVSCYAVSARLRDAR
jgi:predicted MFS family arabinose efflux permease